MNNPIPASLLNKTPYLRSTDCQNTDIRWKDITEGGGILTQLQAMALLALPGDSTLADCRALLGSMRVADALNSLPGDSAPKS